MIVSLAFHQAVVAERDAVIDGLKAEIQRLEAKATVVDALHADAILRLEQQVADWMKLALDSVEYQRDENSRLLTSRGVMPSPNPDAPPLTIAQPAMSQDQAAWEAVDELAEMREKAREAALNPAQAEYWKEASLYDPSLKPLVDMIDEFSRR